MIDPESNRAPWRSLSGAISHLFHEKSHYGPGENTREAVVGAGQLSRHNAHPPWLPLGISWGVLNMDASASSYDSDLMDLIGFGGKIILHHTYIEIKWNVLL